MESPLDWLSSWNEAYHYRLFLKLLYQYSTYQCNSVATYNGGIQYHVIDPDPTKYSYRQGNNWAEIDEFVKSHINLNLVKNPLISLHHDLLKMSKEGLFPLSMWGERQVPAELFNITNTKHFGFGLHPELLKFFNVCGFLFQSQVRWWNSNLCRFIRSARTEALVSEIGRKCSAEV